MFRSFILLCVFVPGFLCGQVGYIYTVQGKISIQDLKFTLTHEHIMSNFGALPSVESMYDSAALMAQVIPYLKMVKSQGVSSIIDCTAAYFGRHVTMLKIISELTSVQIITNTGFYGAYNDYYVPEFVKSSTVEHVAAIWIDEFENGIHQTGIKPGFIKLGFDSGVPSEIDMKLFKAGIFTHLHTGLTMVVHTGNNVDAVKVQLRLMEEGNVASSAWVWAHANLMDDLHLLRDVALKGGWISLDGVKENNVQEYVEKLKFFKLNKLLHKVLLSHDGNSFPRGGAIRKYDAIPTALIPELLRAGFSNKEIDQLMIINPQEAFQIRVRKR